MLQLNCLTGGLSMNGEAIEPGKVLMYLEYTLCSEEKERFTLLGFKRLLQSYPMLKLTNSWADTFVEMALEVIPTFWVAGRDKPESIIRSLEIQKTHSTVQQHYTAHYDLSLEGIKTWYDEGHSLSQSAQADLYGIDADGNDVSLSDQNLKDYFFLPIRIRPGLHKYAELFVLDDYTDLDESRLVHVETLDAEPGITLGELVHTILMDINLDDADDLRELIQSRIDDLVVDFPENLDD